MYKRIVEKHPSIESHLSKSRSRGKVVHHYNCLPCCWFSLASFSPPLLPLTRPLPSPSLLFSSFFFHPCSFSYACRSPPSPCSLPLPSAHAHPSTPPPLPSGELRDCFNTPDGQNCDPVPTTVGIYRRDLSRVFRSRLEPARAHYALPKERTFLSLLFLLRKDRLS